MTRRLLILVSLIAAAAPSPAIAGDPFEIKYDRVGDAVARRTDPGADGPLDASQTLPDLLSIRLSRWAITPGTNDRFIGGASATASHLFRLDIVFAGLLNPPGPLSDIHDPYAPFIYGPSPLYGFVEFNVDRRVGNDGKDTGGDHTATARSRYLANVGRFGGIPSDSNVVASRVVTRPGQLDDDFATGPQFERSGAEFVFKICGCEDLEIVQTSVAADSSFTAGDTWILRGRLFERTSGFNAVSLMTCPAQRYAPMVDVRFSHSTVTDQTTVSMVYALTQEGARQLAGLPSVPPINSQLGCDGNEGSIHEALADAIAGVTLSSGSNWNGVDLVSRAISQGWAGRGNSIANFLDPTDWRFNAIFGTTYTRSIAAPSFDGADFIWTDAYPDCDRGDQNGDTLVNDLDVEAIRAHILASDGGPRDADGIVNGVLVTPDFGIDFDMADINYDGRVDCRDIALLGGPRCCPADWNSDGIVGPQDLFAFLVDWFNGTADFNASGTTSLQDLFDFLSAYFARC